MEGLVESHSIKWLPQSALSWTSISKPCLNHSARDCMVQECCDDLKVFIERPWCPANHARVGNILKGKWGQRSKWARWGNVCRVDRKDPSFAFGCRFWFTGLRFQEFSFLAPSRNTVNKSEFDSFSFCCGSLQPSSPRNAVGRYHGKWASQREGH